jgi:hypothetical protein
MTDQLYARLTQAMDRICSHPIALVFRHFRETRDSDPLIGLDEISDAVQGRRYRTLEDWLRDIRRLRDECTVRAAGEVERLARREYQQLLLFTGSEAWFERYGCVRKKL